MTWQDKTRQGKARQDKTRNDKTRQDKIDTKDNQCRTFLASFQGKKTQKSAYLSQLRRKPWQNRILLLIFSFHSAALIKTLERRIFHLLILLLHFHLLHLLRPLCQEEARTLYLFPVREHYYYCWTPINISSSSSLFSSPHPPPFARSRLEPWTF